MEKALYFVKPIDSFEAEGRYFFKGESYPVFHQEGEYVKLVAENGDFIFHMNLMEEAIQEWELKKQKTEEVK